MNKSKRYLIHLQLVSMTEDGKPINSEIAFTHDVQVTEKAWDDWEVRRIIGSEVSTWHVSHENASDAIGVYIACVLAEKGLDEQ